MQRRGLEVRCRCDGPMSVAAPVVAFRVNICKSPPTAFHTAKSVPSLGRMQVALANELNTVFPMNAVAPLALLTLNNALGGALPKLVKA